MARKLAIKAVVAVKQREPAVFEMLVRLGDGTPAVVEVSTAAFVELLRRGCEIFPADARQATASYTAPRSSTRRLE